VHGFHQSGLMSPFISVLGNMRQTPAYYKQKVDAVQQGVEYLASIGQIQPGRIRLRY